MAILKFESKLIGRNKEDFQQEIIDINLQRIRSLSILAIGISFALMLVIDIPIWQTGLSNVEESYRMLTYLHIALGFSMFVFLCLSCRRIRSAVCAVTWADRAICESYCLTVSVLCALFSINDQLIDGAITIYIIGVFTIAIMNYINPIKSLAIYLISYVFFITGITMVQKDHIVLRAEYVNSLIIIVLAWFMSMILYNAKVKEFLARSVIQNQKMQLNEANLELEKTNNELLESFLALDESQNMIFTLAFAIESKDEYTRGHSERVVDYSMALADHIGLDDSEKEKLRHAAILHDTGKIGVPDLILNKSDGLSEEEWMIMKSHPERGEKICSKLKFAQDILPVIRHHHERYDGKGYPDGLKGDNIPYLARIVSIADTVDAITSDRPYRPAMAMEQALEELEGNAGAQFDPFLVKAYIEMHKGR